MEEIEKITTEITEGICDIEVDFYCRKIAVGTESGKIYIFENTNGSMDKILEMQVHNGPIFKLAWSHPSFGPILATCGFDKKVNIFNIIQNYKLEKIYEHEMHDNCINTLKFSPSINNLVLISGDLNGNIITCDYLNKDFILQKIFAHDFGVNSIDFLDENKFVTCGNDNLIKIWNYSQENGNVVIKCETELKDNNMNTKDLSCKDSKHFVCCGYLGDEGVINYYILDEENKWEIKKIYENKGKLEKIRFNEEHTCMAIIDENGKESVIMESDLNL
jgi:protein transport protein SEC13